MSATPLPLLYSCVVAAITAVSETGAMLSPKAAPDSIAPPSHTGSPPNATPAGNSVRLMALIVPNPDPVLTANSPENRNTTTVNIPPPICSQSAAHTSPSTMRPSLSTIPYTPTTSHSSVAVMAVLLPIYSNTVLQYVSASFAKNVPTSTAPMPTATSKSTSTAPKKDSPMALTTKRANGTNEAPSPIALHLLLVSCSIIPVVINGTKVLPFAHIHNTICRVSAIP